jgi:hypothetical protein
MGNTGLRCKKFNSTAFRNVCKLDWQKQFEICVIIPSWNSSKAFDNDILGIRDEFKVKLMQNDISHAQITL